MIAKFIINLCLVVVIMCVASLPLAAIYTVASAETLSSYQLGFNIGYVLGVAFPVLIVVALLAACLITMRQMKEAKATI